MIYTENGKCIRLVTIFVSEKEDIEIEDIGGRNE